MKKIIIVEVGSTTTKAYLCENEVKEISRVVIPFKENYKKENKLNDEDISNLIDYINKLKEIDSNINVYGTSIFRNLVEREKEEWLTLFKNKTGYDFHIVSSKEENEYTVYGAMDKNYQGTVAVMIGGGGSTELAFLENGGVINECNQNFGAVDISNLFPELTSDYAKTDFNEMLIKVKEKLVGIKLKADILILAGGDYIYFYETLFDNITKNNITDNPLQPYMISKEDMEEYDRKFFYDINLDEIKEKTNNPIWWAGSRAMRLCVRAIFDEIDAKYIVPTKINMVYGIINKLKEEQN